MLATRWDDTVPAEGLIVQEKVDGWRACWVDGELRTRGGAPLDGVEHIAAELRLLDRAFGQRMFLDGEFQVDGTLAATKAYAERGWRSGEAQGQLILFDALPREEWRWDTYEIELADRLAQLDATAAKLDLRHVSVAPWWVQTSADGIQADARQVWDRDGEGLVVKHPRSTYRRGRTRSWLKVKRPGIA